VSCLLPNQGAKKQINKQPLNVCKGPSLIAFEVTNGLEPLHKSLADPRLNRLGASLEAFRTSN